MADQVIIKFPPNPTDGTVFEISKGIYYRYEKMTNSWNRVTTSSASIPLATRIEAGLLSAEDYKKLNKLMVPPLSTTLTGGDCPTQFVGGVFDLRGEDGIIGINGKTLVRNTDEFGQELSKTYDFQITENTYGFDFTVDLEALTKALTERGNFKTGGIAGDKGEKGPVGDPGSDFILSGPIGPQGKQGTGPGCSLTVEPEPFSAASNGTVIVDVRLVLDPCDMSTYKLEFDRQAIGVGRANRTILPPSKVNATTKGSKWILAKENAIGSGEPYYVDISQIENAIADKYEEQLTRLKVGYETTANYWLEKMSDLYDEQKSALCVALEYCNSISKNDALRRHVENVAATAAISGAKVSMVTRKDSAATTVSGNSLLQQLVNANVPTGRNNNNFPSIAGAARSNSITSPFANVTVQEGGVAHGGVTIVDGTAFYPNGSSKVVDQNAADTAAAAKKAVEDSAAALAASVSASGGDGVAAANSSIANSIVDQLYVRMKGEGGYVEGFLLRSDGVEYSNELPVYTFNGGTKKGNSSWSIKYSATESGSSHYAAIVNVSGLVSANAEQFVQFNFAVSDTGVDIGDNIDAGQQREKSYDFIWERVFSMAGMTPTPATAPAFSGDTTPPAVPPSNNVITPPAPPPAVNTGAIDTNLLPRYCIYKKPEIANDVAYITCVPVRDFQDPILGPELNKLYNIGLLVRNLEACEECPYPTEDSNVTVAQWRAGERPSEGENVPNVPPAPPSNGQGGFRPDGIPPQAPPSIPNYFDPANMPGAGGAGIPPGFVGQGTIPGFTGGGAPPALPPSNEQGGNSGILAPGTGGAGIPPYFGGGGGSPAGAFNVPPAAPAVPPAGFTPISGSGPIPPNISGGPNSPGFGGAGIPPATSPNYGEPNAPPAAPALPLRAGIGIQREANTDKGSFYDIDPVFNNNRHNGLPITLGKGVYRLTIVQTHTFIDGKYWTPLRVATLDKVYRLVDKGAFDAYEPSAAAYKNMTMMVNVKENGSIFVFLPTTNPARATGIATVRIDKVL